MRPYLYAGVAVLVAALVATIFYYRADAAYESNRARVATEALGVAIGVNHTLNDTITNLNIQAQFNDELVADLQNQLAELAEIAGDNQAELERLREAEPDVKSYLDTPVPDALRRLYDPATGSHR
jgi:LysB family phage lysis regulatory protein